MADEQDLAGLEVLCKQLYETTNATERQEAEKALLNFTNAPNCLNKCQLLLERGTSGYAQLLAASSLTKLVSRNSAGLPLEQRIDIRNYVLNYLATRPKLANFVTQALILLYARITKLGWFDSEKEEFIFRNVIDEVTKLLQGSVEHCIIGVQILAELTNEMNQPDTSRPLTKHRKVASSFRDTMLYDIFTLSCQLLRQASGKNLNFQDENQVHSLMTQLLRLAHSCLTFDFIGTSTDESSDDLCTVQIPTNWRTGQGPTTDYMYISTVCDGSQFSPQVMCPKYWRPVFLDLSTVTLFFDLYETLPPSLSPLSISCLVQIASVRRSLFNNAERAKFLSHLVQGVKRVLTNPQGLSEPSNYHEFCRLLARLKSNYQLGELVKVDNYPEIIALIAKFTVESLQMWQFAPNSVHYLLSLWQRMVASVPYVKATEPHLLETYTPEVTKAYITSRLESVHLVMRDGFEDPLEDTGSIQQQLDQLSTIGRCEYEKTCTLLIQLFDESAQAYQRLIQSPAPNGTDLAIQEGRLTWLVYIIGAVIGGRVSFASCDEHDALDGELVCRVLQLMNLTDSRLAQGGSEKLDLAMLSFFEQFRKIYVGDQVQKTSKVYKRLSEVLGLNDESMVLSVFIGKIITNLKYWGSSEAIISRTLQLLSDLSVGYSSVRKLVKLEAVQFVLNNHTSEHFPFLGVNTSNPLGDMRCRTTFYIALGRLLMVDLGEDEERFEQFMMPLTTAFESVGQQLANMDRGGPFNEEQTKRTLIGLARDLRGVVFAFNTKTSYMMLFDWMYPSYHPILLRAAEMWYHDPLVTTPVLKLMAELVQNRSQRLQFDVSSPSGILLFRETSKMLVSYGSRVLTLGEVPKDQVYALKLKGIAICFSMLKAALCGGYVNFGVFRLYGDGALDDALNIFIKLLLAIPHSDLLDYPKLSQAYYSLLECLAQDHMNFISNLDPPVFMYILSSIQEGLTALDTMVCTGCCATLDHIVTYLFKRLSKGNKKRPTASSMQENDAFLRILEVHPEIFQQMLSTVLNIIMFEDCRNQWSMSRPLLGLILLNEEYFNELRKTIISSQPPDKQQAMALCFENLMDGIERSLLTKNRDRFTQNLSVFRRDVNDSLKAPSSSSVGLNSADMMN
ncbi:exportin-7-like isoform X5 [Branchiostoma lanceolatum]|uniref:exportin-7-like isoform X5 n=1 Tax=Branchiostoma lanceolatum TaxID=7740 RepID=UPI0034541663